MEQEKEQSPLTPIDNETTIENEPMDIDAPENVDNITDSIIKAVATPEASIPSTPNTTHVMSDVSSPLTLEQSASILLQENPVMSETTPDETSARELQFQNKPQNDHDQRQLEQEKQQEQQEQQEQEQQQQEQEQQQQQKKHQEQEQQVQQQQQQQQAQQQQQSDFDAITQLQQLSATHSQLAQAAVAALSGNSNFPFLANFENLAAMAAAASENNNENSSLHNDANALQSLAQHNNTQQSQQRQSRHQQQVTDLSQLPTELLKRELMNQKVRADNRERKKRWRQQNEERNKDNDLRCRVNKRAHKLFGKDESEHKKKWIEEEFKKRQQKRKDKERRKGLVDNSLGAHTQNSLHHNSAIDINVITQHLNPQNTLATLSDVNYLQLLCNNLGIPAAARTIIGSVAGNTSLNNNTNNQTTENNTQDHQQHFQPQEQQPASTTDTSAGTSMSTEVEDNKDDSKDKSLQPFPFQILEILQQLQQYQPQNTTSNSEGETTTNDFQLPQSDQDQQNFNNGLGNMSDRPEEKLAALLATTLQAATAAAAASQVKEDEKDNQNNTSSENNTTSDQHHQNSTEDQNNSAEFPMDAVLTLMQLNAGWRQ